MRDCEASQQSPVRHAPGQSTEQLLRGCLGVVGVHLSNPPWLPTVPLWSLETLTPLPFFFFNLAADCFP